MSKIKNDKLKLLEKEAQNAKEAFFDLEPWMDDFDYLNLHLKEIWDKAKDNLQKERLLL